MITYHIFNYCYSTEKYGTFNRNNRVAVTTLAKLTLCYICLYSVSIGQLN